MIRGAHFDDFGLSKGLILLISNGFEHFEAQFYYIFGLGWPSGAKIPKTVKMGPTKRLKSSPKSSIFSQDFPQCI